MKRSDTVVELVKSLSAAQGEMTSADQSGHNPHFDSKYSTLQDVWNVCRGPLSKHGLALVQPFEDAPNGVVVETTLFHVSGEWLSTTMVWHPKDRNPQSVASAISYGKRYALMALLGIPADEEDDGSTASGPKNRFGREDDINPPPKNPPPKNPPPKNPPPKGGPRASHPRPAPVQPRAQAPSVDQPVSKDGNPPPNGSSPGPEASSETGAPTGLAGIPERTHILKLVRESAKTSNAWTHDDLGFYLKERFEKSAIKELTLEQYRELAQTISTQPAYVAFSALKPPLPMDPHFDREVDSQVGYVK